MRVTKRFPSDTAKRRVPVGVWLGACGFLIGLVLGVLASGASGAGATVSWIRESPSRIRDNWAGSRLRSQLPALELSVDFEAYEALVAPEFQLWTDAVDVECVPATVAWRGVAGDVQLCPPRTGGASPEMPFPAFELREDDDVTPLSAGAALLRPADGDAALVQGYFDSLRDQGLPVPSYEIIRVSVNGSTWGVYTAASLLPAETLSSSDDSMGGFVVSWNAPYSSSSYAWAPNRSFADAIIQLGTVAGSDSIEWNTTSDAGQGQSLAVTSALSGLQEVIGGRREVSDVVDAQRLGRFMALTALWRGCMMPDWRALRLVPDVASGLLVPMGSGLPQHAAYSLPFQFYADPEVQRVYVQALDEYSDPAFLADHVRLSELEALYDALDVDADRGSRLRGHLDQHQEAMRAMISPAKTLRAFQRESDGDLLLVLEATEPVAVEVLGIDVGEQGTVALDRDWVVGNDVGSELAGDDTIVLPGRVTDLPRFIVLRVPLVEFPTVSSDGGELLVDTRIWGLDRHVRVPVLPLASSERTEGF